MATDRIKHSYRIFQFRPKRHISLRYAPYIFILLKVTRYACNFSFLERDSDHCSVPKITVFLSNFILFFIKRRLFLETEKEVAENNKECGFLRKTE